MKMNMFQRLNEPEVDGGSAGPSVGEGSAPSLDSSVSKAVVPDFADLATFDESLELADSPNSVEPNAGAAPSAASAPAVSTPPSQAAAQPSAAAPAQPPAAAPASQVPPGQQATPPAAAPAQPPAATPAASAAEPPKELTFEQHREKAIPELSKLFQMTAEEAEAFAVEPQKVLPTLAARVAFESMNMAYVSVMRALPDLIQGQMNHIRGATEANDKFFKAWPDLNKPEHEALIRSSIKSVKLANPGADLEKIIKLSGAMAYISLGLPIPNVTPPAAPAATPPAPRPSGVGATGAPLPMARSQGVPDPIADLVRMEADGLLD